MCNKAIKSSYSLIKAFVFVMITLVVTNTNASPLYYTFEGTITGFSSYNNSISLTDYDVTLGQTTVSYIYEVDFNLNTSSYTNSAATWDYFYSDLLYGGIVNGENSESNKSFNAYFNSMSNQGRLVGGSRVEIFTTESLTSLWKIEDWFVGQQLRLLDSGFISAGTGGAIYFSGNVELIAISTTNPIPEPSTLLLFIAALGCFYLTRHKLCGKSNMHKN